MSYSVFIKTLRRLWEKWWELEHLNSRVAVLTDKYDGKRYSVVAESPPFQRWDECVDKFISINT